MDSSNQEEDLDDSYDKSSTLKANNQIQQTTSFSNTTTPNTSANSASKPINNKFNSEKSIYFSSVIIIIFISNFKSIFNQIKKYRKF